MRLRHSSLCTALAMALALGTVAPSAAAPVFVPKAVPASASELVQVQAQDFRWRRDNRRWDRRGWDRDRRDRFERRGNVVYWRGHRGFRYHRPGYRRHNGWWFPPAAFALGAIVGGALSQQAPVRTMNSAHVQWCYNRFRSYRSSDNTFQPYNGPRRPCISPYS